MQREDVHRAIANAGLDSHAQELMTLIRPSIRITTHPARLDQMLIGASRFGGIPDLPLEMEWPGSLGFVGQINLHEVASYDILAELPHTGWLYFFCQIWHHPEGPQDWKVLYFEGEASNLQRRLPEGGVDRMACFEPCSLNFRTEFVLPLQYGSPPLQQLGLTEQEQTRYIELLHEVRALIGCYPKLQPGTHRLLGYNDSVQGIDVEGSFEERWKLWSESENIASETINDWRPLLQVDTDNDMDTMWGDCGMIYYGIRQSDLVVQQFGSTWLILEEA
jgi:hypothetical protein